MKLVSVIGGSQILPSSEEYSFAYKLGKLIAKKGWGVVCGGKSGVMEAVCRGAKEEGGLTVGIMPSLTGEDANPYVDIKINTGLGHARNPIVVASGEIVVAIGGNYGTLSEIAYSLIYGKTVLGYKTHKIEGVIQISKPEEVKKYLK
ncbi:TIGR00725 family protein [Persephonella atlantica]|nr:TIGR00725 family protein [Persephonella atlantica]